ncbi:MAG: hypothetical protein AAF614_27955, partial [Chloroflexota bacterium]
PTPTPTQTATPTSSPASTQTPTPTPTPSLRIYQISGNVLGIDLPEWVTNPVRGSVTFNRIDEINETKQLTARLSIRDESGVLWEESEPELILTLNPGEQFCKVVPGEFNKREEDGTPLNYWVGFQAHCEPTNTCSYNMEGQRLWVTVHNVEILIAPVGADCPDF